jgi:hypothetical protein
MNQQPIAGIPLRYKYMDTMGSALSNNRIQSNMLQNAIFARRTKVVTISRTNNCGEYNNCGNRPLCKLNTGNINPNFINFIHLVKFFLFIFYNEKNYEK